MRSTFVGGVILCATVALLVAAAPASGAPSARASAACGTPLNTTEVSEIVSLSHLDTLPSGPTLARLAATAARLNGITDILVHHRDRRALFALGLDALEQQAVLPLQRRESAFDDPDYAHRLSIEVMSQFLVNLHGEFVGGHVEPRWARHFALAHDCSFSLGRVALAGYNAHYTVDMPRAVAAIGSRPGNARDYFTVLDTIGRNTNVIVERTKAVFGGAVGPVLDALSFNGFTTAGFAAFNAVNFANVLALQNPSLRGATEAAMGAQWKSVDIAVQAL
ncbi:DUF5995 family protein [Gordonia rhizosphera]|uniref:Transglycosylase SLT domain-containing protein n=1 Tax=Gordonia rhizosphera NBRC 16068 TaxID=1108045 RepID=K6W524_9ACTN|nr:DUF5995 family protein [Gordonia rhizosphera]GAB88781.1 hypothetical protein GORHZ_040_00140 [Gordonia rhizosphera NBRC 16068]